MQEAWFREHADTRCSKKMAKLNHPDKQGGNAEKMEKINQAYEVLGNEGE